RRSLMVAWSSLAGVVCLLLAAPPAELDVTADEAVLRGAKVGTDGPALLEFFRNRTPAESTPAHIDALIEKLSSGKFREREKATAELLRVGLAARPALVKVRDHKDAEVRRRVEELLSAVDKLSSLDVERAAVRVLRARRPAGTGAALLDFLP